jgi:hypothetical protein
MQIVITAADVYSALDAERPFGSLRRIGGGAYRFDPVNGEPTDHKDYESAVDDISKQVTERESDPASDLKRALARIVVLESKLREVGVATIEALPIGVKGG